MTVRQQSTMDKSGTLPIYLYNNCETEEFDAIPLLPPLPPPVAIAEHADDIEQEPQPAGTRTRRAKRARQTDMIYYS